MGLIVCLGVAVALASWASGASSAASGPGSNARHCTVGKPTAWKTNRFGSPGKNPGIKFFSPVLVLACGSTGFLHEGALEIVGYDTSEGLCTSAQVARHSLFGGPCFPAGIRWQDFSSGPVSWTGAGWGGGGPKPSATNLAGYIEPDVASVEVRFRRDGKIWTKAATVAQVDGELLAKLHQTEPFGRFAALLPGCVPPQEINVVARGASGVILGSQRGEKSLVPDFCHPAAAFK